MYRGGRDARGIPVGHTDVFFGRGFYSVGSDVIVGGGRLRRCDVNDASIEQKCVPDAYASPPSLPGIRRAEVVGGEFISFSNKLMSLPRINSAHIFWRTHTCAPRFLWAYCLAFDVSEKSNTRRRAS